MPKQERTILILELKGFAAQATELAKRVEEVGITPERIRSAAQTHIASAVAAAEYGAPNKALRRLQIGDDTWYFTFADVDDTAILFLRRYNEVRDIVSMGGSMMIRNERISQQLREHFVEGVKAINRFKPAHFSALERQFSFSRESIDAGEDLVKALFEA